MSRTLRRLMPLGAALGLAACLSSVRDSAPTLTPGPASPAPTRAAESTAGLQATDTPGALRRPVSLWLPPGFAPDPATPAGQYLAASLREFEQKHPDSPVSYRLKQPAGRGGLLDSLITAYNAAPDVLPDLVALEQDDLAAAAAAGLLVALDDKVPADVLADYYPVAQSMGRPQGAVAGLPFAVEARVLVFRTDFYPAAPHLWSETITGTLVVPGAEALGLTVLNEYLALGGPLYSPDGALLLDVEILTEALAPFEALRAAGILPESTLVYTDTAATWQVFRERRAALALTGAQQFLGELGRVQSASATWIPSGTGAPFALASGWSWAVVSTSPEQQEAAVELLLWLVEADRLAAWTRAANYLPPRAAALAGWGADPSTPFAAAILTGARLRPRLETLQIVGPPLRRALEEVVTGRASPFAAAVLASQEVASP